MSWRRGGFPESQRTGCRELGFGLHDSRGYWDELMESVNGLGGDAKGAGRGVSDTPE